MRIIIIRHGDPDYEHDSLTPRGDMEAKLLARIIDTYDIDAFYISPLGRAQRTASFSLDATGKDGVTLDWLREFPPRIKRPDLKENRTSCSWDWLPSDWTEYPEFYDRDLWYTVPVMEDAHVKEAALTVHAGLDSLLAEYGYVRDGLVYKAVRPNHDTIALVCHFGVEMVILAHLMSISPMPLWHGFVAAPTAITSIYTEERVSGIASFRINEFGATPHLLLGGMPPSKRARYIECFGDPADSGFEVDK